MPIEKKASGRDKVCPKCGTTLSECRRTGLVGCAYCYEVFREDIVPCLADYQGGVSHAGAALEQAGARSDDTYGLVFAYNTAKAEMEQAIIRGDYAKAQSLTVRVGELHKKLFSRDKN